MNYIDFYEKMKECQLISNDWRNLIPFLSNEISNDANLNDAMILFIMYFSLVDDGNTFLPLEKITLIKKFKAQIEHQKITLLEEADKAEDISAFDDLQVEISRVAENTSIIASLSVVGSDKLFIIGDNRLFERKYYNAVKSIKESTERLFNNNTKSNCVSLNLENVSKFGLKEKQKDVITTGINKNLFVTGGPGTGKTTSIFFLLLGLLCNDPDYNIYLTAPSAKAATRMSDSLKEGGKSINDDVLKGDTQNLITSLKNKITTLEGQTIHRLLKVNKDGGFIYNKDYQFGEKSVFVIDEASMIDVCLFASLLEAIPNDARVFILGDKNQLPSVECGAVFGELLALYKDNVVELTETNRFSKDSEIYSLSEKVNRGESLGLNENDFLPIDDFCIPPQNATQKEIYLFADNQNSNKDIVTKLTTLWYEKYFNGFQNLCKNLKVDQNVDKFAKIIEQSEKSKILCALRETTRGADHINDVILEKYYKGKKYSNFYPGEVLIVTKNLDSLHLYNGDCGVTVQFENDETLYFMINKIVGPNIDTGEKLDNQIFKLGEFYFYPIRMIGREDISRAFAITIHKAQGSGYKDVFIVLPKNNGHPLLNRQLVYTAITRSEKHAYIISNANNLEHASKTPLVRDTGILI